MLPSGMDGQTPQGQQPLSIHSRHHAPNAVDMNNDQQFMGEPHGVQQK